MQRARSGPTEVARISSEERRLPSRSGECVRGWAPVKGQRRRRGKGQGAFESLLLRVTAIGQKQRPIGWQPVPDRDTALVSVHDSAFGATRS